MVPTAPCLADANERAVLAAVIGRAEPLTLREIIRLAGLPAYDVEAALAGLRRAGLVRRLNTLVESYTVRS